MKESCRRALWSVVVLTTVVGTAWGQPPGQGGRPPGNRQGGGAPPRYELGTVLPPFMRDELQLTKEQQKQIADLEKEVKERLNKILTPEQKKRMETMRPRGPGGPDGPPPGGQGGPGGPPPQNSGDRKKPGNPDRNEEGTEPQANAGATGGIQWYATLARGLAEAKRTGKPILFLSAAPHCGGVSGIW